MERREDEFRMFGRMSGQKPCGFLPIRQEDTVCYSKNRTAFVRHEPDIPELITLRPPPP